MRKFVLLVFISFFCCVSCAGAQEKEKKEIKVSDILKAIKKGEPVLITGKIIMDDLDFTQQANAIGLNGGALQVEISSNIFFNDCVFIGKVTANNVVKSVPVQTVFRNNLVFLNCDFRNEVNFDNAVVFGTVNFSKSIFRGKTSFNNLSVWAKDSYFSEIEAEQPFSMIYSLFNGNVSFMNATFLGGFSFQETTVRGKLLFNNAVFAQRADFDMIEVAGRAFFNYAEFQDSAGFMQSRFLNSVEFVNTTFKNGTNFEKTYIGYDIKTDGLESEIPVDFSNAFFVKKQNIYNHEE